MVHMRTAAQQQCLHDLSHADAQLCDEIEDLRCQFHAQLDHRYLTPALASRIEARFKTLEEYTNTTAAKLQSVGAELEHPHAIVSAMEHLADMVEVRHGKMRDRIEEIGVMMRRLS